MAYNAALGAGAERWPRTVTISTSHEISSGTLFSIQLHHFPRRLLHIEASPYLTRGHGHNHRDT
jgi:hypothetical protein